MTHLIERLYHLAEPDNLPSILKHGLVSTQRLVAMASLPEPEAAALLRTHRPGNICLPNGTVIRDQRPMPPRALSPALDGMEPADWYALLNGFVFLWPDRNRMDRQRAACGDRPQVALTFDAKALFDRFADEAFVSPINSGNARRKPARRGRDTFVPYTAWLQDKWPTGNKTRPPAEIVFKGAIPAKAPFLVDIATV